MQTDSIGGYRLSQMGTPSADVICPHGRPIAYINLRNYDYEYDDSRQPEIGLEHLAQFLRASAEGGDLAEYCISHRPSHEPM